MMSTAKDGKTAAEQQTPPPHVLLVSFPSQGNLNPLLRLAKRIAAKGPLVTFSTMSLIGGKIAAANESAAKCGEAGMSIGRGRLRFESLPDEVYSKDAPFDVFISHLENVCPGALAALIRRQADAGRPVSCVIHSPFTPWATDVAVDAGIPSAVLWVQSCAIFSMFYHYKHSLVEFPSEANPDVVVSLPGLPPLSVDEVSSFLLESNTFKPLTKALLIQFEKLPLATWVFANSFEELEQSAIAALSKLQPLTPVGPLIELDDESSTVKGDMLKSDDECIDWLDQQELQSVVYVSLGSIFSFTEPEMGEMAHGLLSSGRPFLWVVRPDYRKLLPAGFSDELGRSKGMIVSWSPQDRVLGHRAVGCFLSHCGWNSSLEALSSGVPVITYPHLGDQLTNAKFFVDVYKTGVRLQAPVKSESLMSVVEEILAGPDAKAMRERAEEMKRAARTAVATGGSSDRNIQAFVDELYARVAAAASEKTHHC